MMITFNYKENDIVYFDLGNGIKGLGKILGCTTNGAPIIGMSYIIEPIEFTGKVSIPNETYPFHLFTAFESMIQLMA